MLTREEFETRSQALLVALQGKLGVRGSSLPKALKRAGRLLPKSVRASGSVLTEAQNQLVHPKIARLVDDMAVDKAFQTIEAHLDGIDPKEKRKDAMLRWLAVLIINLAVVAALTFAVLRWQGYA